MLGQFLFKTIAGSHTTFDSQAYFGIQQLDLLGKFVLHCHRLYHKLHGC